MQNDEVKLTERQFALTAAAQAFCNRGITIACPWEGDLDDEERERFDALVAAIDSYVALSAIPSTVSGETGAARDVLAERKRQVEAEGWTPEHDDAHGHGEMASAAGVYALAAGSADYRWVAQGLPPNDYLAAAMKLWPWEPKWFKPTNRRRDLVKAGALILAEIERLDRASPANPAETQAVEVGSES